MLDHLKFDSKNWFSVDSNANQIEANGKRYVAFPPKVIVNQDYAINTSSSGMGKIKWTNCPILVHSYKKGTEATCIGVDGDCYVLADLIDYCGGDTPRTSIAIVGKDLFSEKWGGGKALLSAVISMVERAFTQFKKGAETC